MPKKATKRKTSTQSKKSPMKKTGRGMKGGMSNVAGPAAGAVIGAALGTAAGAVLTNDKAKKTIGKVVSDLGEYSQGAAEALQDNKENIKKAAGSIASDAIEKTKSKIK